MIETASDAISDLALSPNFSREVGEKQVEEEDTLLELVGTLTQRNLDQLRLSPCQKWSDADYFRDQRTRSQTRVAMEESYSSGCQQIDDEAELAGLIGLSRGRSRRMKPVAVPLATS